MSPAKKEAAPKAEKKVTKTAAVKKEAAPKAPKAAKKASSADSGALALKFYDVLVQPLITEKSTRIAEQNKVVFKINATASKTDVKRAVEKLFNVSVTKVNTMNVEGKEKRFRGKVGHRKDFRKAIVTLAAGQSIDFAAGARK